MTSATTRMGSFFFRHRNALGPLLFILALVGGTPAFPFGRADLNTLFDGIGIAVALCGQALRIVTIGYEYIERGGRNRQVYASKLVQGGMFAHCRNPLYLGNLLLAIGLALVVHSLVFYLLVLPLVLYAYVAIVSTEEAFLRDKFGAEYAAYCARVNRWLPNMKGWRHSIAEMRFNWRRVLVKEYNTIFVTVLALTAVKLWSDYQVQGPGVLPPRDTMLAALGIWLVGYLAVRGLKKSGYVRA